MKIQKGKELITMMKILIDQLDYCVRACERMNERVARKCFYDQAFGAVQYHIILFPGDTAEVESLWNDYRVRFEEIVYGIL